MSGLPALVKCGWREILLSRATVSDESGAAADTGSAGHAGVAAWHTNGKDRDAAEKVLRESIAKYPLANLDDAARFFRAYTEDPRNQTAEVVCVEKKVEIAIAPAPQDPTQEMIYIQGTLDQIRRAWGRLYVWDLKFSSRSVLSILHDYTFQLAGYTVAAAREFGAVEPGGFINPKAYFKRGAAAPSTGETDGVFIEIAWTFADCDRLLDSVRNRVAEIRGGYVALGPGDHCNYCPARGIDQCLPLLMKEVRP
jgi:hypothetical protein